MKRQEAKNCCTVSNGCIGSQIQSCGCKLGFKMVDNPENQGMSDAVLAKELNELSIKEREEAYEDVHGVSEEFEETLELIEQSLDDLEVEINKTKKKPAYDKAFFLNSQHVRKREFRIMFLRADNFDAKKAAKRIILHFESKLELFGANKLAKDITLDDLDDDDMEGLLSGSFQSLPTKDQAGRAVIFISQEYSNYKTWQSKLRIVWYIKMVALEDVKAQKKGFVSIFYNCGGLGGAEKLYFDVISKIKTMINDSLPYRNRAAHYCYDNPRILPALSLLQLFMGKENRIRFRSHYGSHIECQYDLMTFGIQYKILPVDAQGEMIRTKVSNFVEERKQIEERRLQATSKTQGVVNPTSDDVLLGRGRPFQEWVGNLRLGKEIDQHRNIYRDASRFEKTCTSMNIVNIIQSGNGRFLQKCKDGHKEENGEWVEVDDIVAREKVSSGFRTKSRKDEAIHQLTLDGKVFPRERGLGADEAFSIQGNKRTKLAPNDPQLNFDKPNPGV